MVLTCPIAIVISWPALGSEWLYVEAMNRLGWFNAALYGPLAGATTFIRREAPQRLRWVYGLFLGWVLLLTLSRGSWL